MKETIVSIMETNFEEKTKGYYNNSWDGVLIATDKQVIRIGIGDDQNCCETFGGMFTQDNIADFIGAEILDIKLTDEDLNSEFMKKHFNRGLDSGGILFVDIITNKGTLQYAVYNSHNGYYGHSIMVESNQLKHRDTL